MYKKFGVLFPVCENENGLRSFVEEINLFKNLITSNFEFIFVDDGNDYEVFDFIKHKVLIIR